MSVRLFFLLYYVVAAVIGFSAISIAIFGALRSRLSGGYIMLIVFHGAYTLQSFVTLVGEYLFTSIEDYSATSVRILYGITTSLGAIVIAAAALYFHRLFSVKARSSRDIFALLCAFLSIVLFSLPNAVRIEPVQGIMIFGPPALAAVALYLLLFSYMLAVGFLGSKRDRPARELLLIWAILGFGAVGIIESAIGAARNFLNPVAKIVFSEGRFPISMVPYLFVSIVMIYYFGSYILADQHPERSIADSFVRRYNISPREQEVASLMNRGLSNREIADKLFLSLATVKTHAHNIFEKTGTKSRYELFHQIRQTRL